MIKPNNNCIKKVYSVLKILTKYDLYPDFTQCSSVTAMADGGVSINILKNDMLCSIDFKTKEELLDILNKWNDLQGRQE